jgi:hypothetical protein
MNGHDRGAHQADRVVGQWPDHFLATLAENEVGIALFLSHWGNPLNRE